MCSGDLSSGIRKNREKLPPLPQIYTDKFVDQMEEFVPHLTELRFNGGEPFAQKIVLDICDMVAEVNPGLKINIATNATVYSKRVRKILEQNNAHINVSIDSLEPEKYAEIRINGKLEKVFKNFELYKQYCSDGKRSLSIMVNPMRNNWWEMINFIEFADKHGVNLWYNTILYPEKYALHNLPSKELKNIYDTLTKKLEDYKRSAPGRKYNIHVGEHLVHNQIKNWLLDSYVV
jgi:cyclic pyranopterin phosphate synthase